MLEDLRWLGIEWEAPVRRQSEHFDDYQGALDRLQAMGLVYPAFMTRGEIRRAVAELELSGQKWPRDPDGSPHYPGNERDMSVEQLEELRRARPQHSWRLNMALALRRLGGGGSEGGALKWREVSFDQPELSQEVVARPELWGDVVLARSDTPTSYHLAVTVDDALQGITHVVRGTDLYEATAVHRLLQTLLQLPEPVYHHHQLVIDADGRKLSKSDGDVSLQALRNQGVVPEKIPELFRFAAQS